MLGLCLLACGAKCATIIAGMQHVCLAVMNACKCVRPGIGDQTHVRCYFPQNVAMLTCLVDELVIGYDSTARQHSNSQKDNPH